jgi:hypothetical protein
MTHHLVSVSKGALVAGALSVCLVTAPARAQVVVIAPPDACVATFAPVYYNGYASYWCGDNWYYRNGPGWGMYGAEPGFLRGWRGSHAPARQFYGRGRPGGGIRAGGGVRVIAGGHAGGGGHGGGGRR